jgi:ATP-dependent DNA helicase RecG
VRIFSSIPLKLFDMKLASIQDIEDLSESSYLECKLAQGKEGRGQLPKDFWETYCAFANTEGGVILLGIKEKDGEFSVAGIADTAEVQKQLFDCLNNPLTVSVNLVSKDSVEVQQIDGRSIISVVVPKATRKQKPVFLRGNPLGNTFRRQYEGDYHCSDDEVKRMLAEQVDDARDAQVLPNYSLKDLDIESFHAYRQMLTDAKPSHPWLVESDLSLLEKLKGYRSTRGQSEGGLTAAGLLMFGRSECITDVFPHYCVDFRDYSDADENRRWGDRVIPDGTWSGNLFDFYRKTYKKLTADLKVPFELRDGQRRDDTPIHQAIREALINSLVHSDYSCATSIVITKSRTSFQFRNPGAMRVSIEQARHGGESDCRNPAIQQMFLMIGLGERAGSGIPRIYSGWQSQEWIAPALSEYTEPEQTRLSLDMLSLMSPNILEVLKRELAEEYARCSPMDIRILATAQSEHGVVTHSRIMQITNEHPRDVSRALLSLVKRGFLNASGKTRGTVYNLAWMKPVTPEDVFDSPAMPTSSSEHKASSSEHKAVSSEHKAVSSEHKAVSSEHKAVSSEHKAVSSEHKAVSSEHKAGSSEHNDSRFLPGGLISSEHLDAEIVSDISLLSTEVRDELLERARPAREKGRLSQEEVREIILGVTRDYYLTLSAIADLLDRSADGIRQQHLSSLVKLGKVKLAFPSSPQHPKQGYKAV